MCELVYAAVINESCNTMADLKARSYSTKVFLEACGNLVERDQYTDFVRPAHFSVQEYFTNPPKNAAIGSRAEYFTSYESAQTQLAGAYMSYLMMNDLGKRERILFDGYAACHFDRHLQSLKDVSTGLQNQLRRLLSSDGKILGDILCEKYTRMEDRQMLQLPNVNAGTFVFATRLCDTPQLNICQNGWAGVNIPSNALVIASHFGWLGVVNGLLDLGYMANTLNASGIGPLYVAVREGHAGIVNQLLKSGGNVNAQGVDHVNILWEAVIRGNFQVTELLLNAGADVNKEDECDETVLHCAVCQEDYELIKLLLDAGADVNAHGGHEGNALRRAAHRDDYKTVKLLLDAGADPNAQGGAALQTAAFCTGNSESVELLLAAGADVNAQGGCFGNALQAAAFNTGNLEAIKLL